MKLLEYNTSDNWMVNILKPRLNKEYYILEVKHHLFGKNTEPEIYKFEENPENVLTLVETNKGRLTGDDNVIEAIKCAFYTTDAEVVMLGAGWDRDYKIYESEKKGDD